MRDSDNDAYSYDAFASVTIASVNNALNQTTSVGGVSTTHDNRGNMTNDGTHAYVYDALDRMTRRAVGEVLQYDAFNRLFQAEDGAAKRRFLYDGSEIIAEMTTAGVIEKRYVRGPGADEVLVEYDTTGVSDVRTWLYADERGSIIAGANDAGTRTFVNTYDEFGMPASANTGSFQYTGQLWLTEVELYHYKARQYNPELGRFMQTDPIGYGDGMNMYNYVGSDPVNGVDPSGTQECTFGCIPPVVAGRNPVFRGPGPTGTAGDTFQRDLDSLDQYEDYLEQCELEQALLETPVTTAPPPAIRSSRVRLSPGAALRLAMLAHPLALALAIPGDTPPSDFDTGNPLTIAQRNSEDGRRAGAVGNYGT